MKGFVTLCMWAQTCVNYCLSSTAEGVRFGLCTATHVKLHMSW